MILAIVIRIRLFKQKTKLTLSVSQEESTYTEVPPIGPPTNRSAGLGFGKFLFFSLFSNSVPVVRGGAFGASGNSF
jgi:hypothetical protein